MFEAFFFYGDLPPHVEKGVYQLPLVVLSYLVAGFASYTALSMAQQLVVERGRWEKRLFHWGGAFAMGAGIWSMHFIGMLSYKMRMAVTYDWGLTFLSMMIAIVVAYGTLGIVAHPRLSPQRLLIGAISLGLGISGMHYTGMAAMKMDAELRYLPTIFSLSVAIAITASAAALWMTFTLSRHAGIFRDLFQVGAALIMAAAICGMHYTGVAAAVFIPYADCRFNPDQNFDSLALTVATITSIIIGIALSIGIYKRTQAEFLFRSRNALLRLLIDSSLDAVVAMNQEGLVTEWNKQAENIFGWSYEDALGEHLNEMIVPAAYRDAHDKGLQKFLKEGAGPILNKRIEMSAVNRSGAEFPIELSVTAQKLGKEVYQFTAFIRDITDRKTAEAQLLEYTKKLERSNQELEDFAHIASHDLREPLRGLNIQSGFLMEDFKDKLGPEGLRRLTRLIQLSQRMEQLVRDLLYFSQMGRAEMAVQEIDARTIIRDVEQMMETFLKEHNARIIMRRPMPKIVCDKPKITTVFRNLITNAVKYNDKPEPLVEVGFLDCVDTPQGQEHNVFYVKDNGIGIESRHHQEIFRIFRRISASVKGKDDGTGVGLSFVKKIIERHNGRIWLDSEPGKGSVFYFTIGRMQ